MANQPIRNTMRLQNKVAVITGAGRGIGKAIALRFSEEGAKVALNDIELTGIETLAGKLLDAGREALAVKADVSNQKEVEQMFALAAQQFGQIDILVNNAGIRRDVPFYKMSAEEWDAVIAVQLKGAFNCARAAQKYMTQQDYGKIINFSSPFLTPPGNEGSTGYLTAAAGVEGFTRALALELGRFNINVNCIAPDYIDTEMTRNAARRAGMYLADYKKFALAQIPLRRLGTPEDVAGVALFLASDESSFVTGQIICVRGGP